MLATSRSNLGCVMIRAYVFLAILSLLSAFTLPAAAEEDPRYAEAYDTLRLETDADVEPETSARGLALLEELAAEGHAGALNTLGIIHLNGLFGATPDPAVAITFYERAYQASEGDLRAAAGYNLATTLSYEAGYGSDLWRRIEEIALDVSANPKFAANARGTIGKAMVLGQEGDRYKDALPYLLDGVSADGADTSLHWLIARGYESGWFGAVDEASACRHFLAASEAGIVHAYWHTGMCYLAGTGVERDSSEAYAWVAQSAEEGVQDGMISRAVMLATGDGIALDSTAAAAWYKKAIALGGQGRAHAMRGLGAMHLVGELGDASDPSLGVALLELAEEGGDGNAHKILTTFEQVRGADRDKVQSLKASLRAGIIP